MVKCDKERVALLVSKEVQQDVTMEDILKIDKVGVKFSWELWLYCKCGPGYDKED